VFFGEDVEACIVLPLISVTTVCVVSIDLG